MKELFRKNYSWVVCFACTLVIFCTTGFCNNLLTVYLPFIQASGITSTQGSALFTIRSVTSLISMLIINRYYQLFSLRKGVGLGLLFSLSSAVLNAIGGSVWFYYVAAACSGFGFSFAGFVPVTLLINNWFRSRRGFAMSISALGSGLATIFFPPVVNRIAETSGLRSAFLFQAAVIAGCTVVVILLVRTKPEDMGVAPYESIDKEGNAKVSQTYDTLDPKDWVLLTFLLLAFGGSIGPALGHHSILFTSCHYSNATAALMISVFGLCQTGGKLLYGILSDAIGALRSSCLCMFFFAAGCCCALLLDGTSLLPCLLVVIFSGLGFAPAMSGISLWCNDFAAGEHYTSTLKWMQVLYSLGTVLLAGFPGRIFAATGEYQSSFFAMGILMLLSLLLLVLLYRINTKRR